VWQETIGFWDGSGISWTTCKVNEYNFDKYQQKQVYVNFPQNTASTLPAAMLWRLQQISIDKLAADGTDKRMDGRTDIVPLQ